MVACIQLNNTKKRKGPAWSILLHFADNAYDNTWVKLGMHPKTFYFLQQRGTTVPLSYKKNIKLCTSQSSPKPFHCKSFWSSDKTYFF